MGAPPMTSAATAVAAVVNEPYDRLELDEGKMPIGGQRYRAAKLLIDQHGDEAALPLAACMPGTISVGLHLLRSAVGRRRHWQLLQEPGGFHG
jgi:hypothetical protein